MLRNRDLVPARKKKGSGRILPGLIAGLVSSVFLALFARAFLLVPVPIRTGDMAPRLKQGESKFAKRGWLLGKIQRGDLVWVQHPLSPDYSMVRRVVAVGGDRVLEGERLLVNEAPADAVAVPARVPSNQTLTLPQNAIYVVAEAAGEGALDSRAFGPVPLEHVLGKIW